ncbi:MAG: hypothetical protein EZS28_002289 [Streblomastix strix]|uniref:Uncharacterized protein n=1 Tax=Streblomastix strix TaxID=222440 RepID=A0A5J4X6P1_9EUKA|nr:MAG: hypothetical protein EZS28_002289 [Streblomastix strix]
MEDRVRLQRQPEVYTICQFHRYQHIRKNKLFEYHCYPTQQREIYNQCKVKDQFLPYTREPTNLKKMTFWMKYYREQQCHINYRTRLTQKQLSEHGKIEDTIWQEIPVGSNTRTRNGIASQQNQSPLHLWIGESSVQMQAFHQSKSTYYTIYERNISFKVLMKSTKETNRSEYMKGRGKDEEIPDEDAKKEKKELQQQQQQQKQQQLTNIRILERKKYNILMNLWRQVLDGRR